MYRLSNSVSVQSDFSKENERPCQRLINFDPAPHSLQSSVFGLAIKPLLPGSQAGSRGPAFSTHNGHATDDIAQPVEGFHPVLFLGAKALRLEHDDTLLSYASIPQSQQFVFVHLRQGRCMNIKPQMDGGGNLVHILAAGALSPNGLHLDFLEGNGNRWRYPERH
jgi:hypothetical protein